MNLAPLILIVDDSPFNLSVLEKLIQDNNMEAAIEQSGKDALKFIERRVPDLVLLDLMMPEMDGYTVCEKMKQYPFMRNVPIIFLTALSDIEYVLKGFSLGGVDYISKPFREYEVYARIKTHLDQKKLIEELEQSNEDLIKANMKLKRANEVISVKNGLLNDMMDKLESAAKIDILTGLYNRRYMMDRIQYEVLRHKRYNNPLSFIIADIDNFKQFNDVYGHDCGDQVLTSVSKKMKESLREQDSIGRWGGEEFMIVLPETDMDGAMKVGEKLRSTIESTNFEYEEQTLKVTLTFGVSIFFMEWGVDETIKRADEALRIGKAFGKNRVVPWKENIKK